jgi:hypothetical protein
MGLRRAEEVRVAGDTGWDERLREVSDDLRAEAPEQRSLITEVYPGGDRDAAVRGIDRQRAEQYSVGPQEAP